MPDLIPLRQAADEYGVHRATLHRYTKAGKLTAYTQAGLGHVTLLDRAELARLFQPQPKPPRDSGEPK